MVIPLLANEDLTPMLLADVFKCLLVLFIFMLLLINLFPY